MIRQPAAAGQFYPAAKESLEKQLRQLIHKKQKIEAKGIILPHAGYVYSGSIAGAVIERIKPHLNYIILGPNHTGIGQPFSIYSNGNWQNPLGEIEINTEISQALLSKSALLKNSIDAHLYEHSIEVQLPFLQYINPDFKFIPIVIGASSLENYKKLGEEIFAVITKNSNADILIIASSDFTHYETQNDAYKKDKLAIDAILKLDVDFLWDVIKKENISMCGYAPCISMITACKKLGATKGELTLYKTSGDITGDKSSVVGYAGIVIN